MKSKYLMLAVVMLTACNGGKNGSDGYGNFETTEVIVSAESSGKIIRLDVREGSKIGKGQQVGLIDTVTLHLKKEQLLARIESVSSQLDNLSAQAEVLEKQREMLVNDRDRVEKLLSDGAATKKQLDDIEGQLEVNRAQIGSVRTQKQSVVSEMNVIRVQLKEVQESIDNCIITSPLEGTVLGKYAEPGEVTGFGRPLFKVADLDTMILTVYVSGSQLSGITIGQQAEVLIDTAGGEMKPVTGVVSWVSETAEFTPKVIQTREERVNLVYAVKIRVPNDGSLKIGMPGEARFRL